MLEIGYKLCSEEHRPNELVQYAISEEDVAKLSALTAGAGR